MKFLIPPLLIAFSILSCNATIHKTTLFNNTVLSSPDTLSPPKIDSIPKIVHFHLPYQMSTPAQSFSMPILLKEISGLSMTAANKEVLTVIQDEDGILFHINKNTGVVEQEIPFYKPGDYEGVEVVGDTIYVVKSTGTLYQVSDLESSPPYVRKHKFFLTKENDVEGLGYDAKENRLLIACKGMPITTDSAEVGKFQKAIYSFYLDDNRLDSKPAFIFSLLDIQNYLKGREAMAQFDKLYSYFKPDAETLIFSPSAIAVHPLTGNIYMTSSPKKILMVFDPQGNILHLEKLDKTIHPQPEGLTFDEDGTLYMANEGKGDGLGTLQKFSYQPELAQH